MEPVTHFLTGACLGRSGFNRKTAYATLAMTLAAEAPDIDIFWGWRGPVAGLEHHRGITHTLIAAPVMALATTGLVWIVHRLRRKEPILPPNWWLIWLFAMIAHVSHLLLDYTNNYGLRPFFPFNTHWHAWSIVFIFDPVIFLLLLGALVLPSVFGLADREIGAKRQQFRGRGWAIAALTLIAMWWGLRNAEHGRALALARTGSYTREPLVRVAAEPRMVDPFAWHVIMETQDYYQTAEVQTIGDQVTTDDADVIYKPPVTAAVAAAKQSYLGKVYLDWSSWPLTTDLGAVQAPGMDSVPKPEWHTVRFEDLRFGYGALTVTQRNDANPPLSGWVVVGPGNEIEGMYMSGKEQK